MVAVPVVAVVMAVVVAVAVVCVRGWWKGRVHPEAQKILSDMATMAARRRGLRDFRLVLRRTQAAVGVQLVRRAVAMLRACLSNDDDVLENFLCGEPVTHHCVQLRPTPWASAFRCPECVE